MLVLMKTTDYFSPDGITSYLYQNGVRYDVPDTLGEQLVEHHQAEKIDLDKEAREAAERENGVRAAATEREQEGREGGPFKRPKTHS